MNESSIVEYFSVHEGYKCGYCKSENSSYSHGKITHITNQLSHKVMRKHL